MEQQSGAHGWDHVMLSPMPLPGQMRLWTMQAIAHGADYVSYFRWRTASYGTEMYWHGILDYDSRDNRRLKELGEIHQDTKRLNGLAGSRYQARVLLMTDWAERVGRGTRQVVWPHELSIQPGHLCRRAAYAYASGHQALERADDGGRSRRLYQHDSTLSELPPFSLAG